MAEAKLVSGRLKISVSFIDRSNQYKVKLCPVVRGERCETQYVGLPGQGYNTSTHGRKLAVDDPRSFQQAAKAAIAFASEDIQSYAGMNNNGNFTVRPPRRRKRR